MILKTSRLELMALTHAQLSKYIDRHELERELGLKPNGRSLDARLIEKVRESILPMIIGDDFESLFSTFWIAVLRNESSIAAECCFKGGPNAAGEVEIGYRSFGSFQNQGIMTETIAALANWAFADERIQAVCAETDSGNIASQRVLEKNGFIAAGKRGKYRLWKLRRPAYENPQP